MSVESSIRKRICAQGVLNVTDEEIQGMRELALDRSNEELEKDLKTIKDWLKKEPHLPDEDDEKFLLTILILNKCSIERTKEKLDAIYSVRNLIPELYIDNEPLNANMQKVMASNVFLPLPKLTEDFGRIMLLKFFIGSNELDIVANFQYIMVVVELRLMFDIALHDHIIVDFAGATFAHSTKFLPTTTLKCVQYIKNTFPNSVKSIHFLNVPPFAQNLINLLNSILIKKLVDRLHIHKDLDSLHKHIPKKLLPREYGGNKKSLLQYKEEWHQFMESQNDLIIQRTKIRSNEKLRIGKLKTFDMFGPEGSFRQINVD